MKAACWKHDSQELWPEHRFWICVHCDLDLGDMTLFQGYMTHPWAMDNSCEILSRSSMTVERYGQDTDFGWVCAVTLQIWPLVNVMAYSWVNCESRLDKGVRSFSPDTMWSDGQTNRQTDRQTKRQVDSYILCLGGGINKRSVMIRQQICPIRAEISTHKHGEKLYTSYLYD